MRFWLVSLFVFSFGIFGTAQEIEGREVAEIRVEGNKSVPTESILMVMETKEGRPLSLAVLREDIQAIYDMGFFAREPIVQPFLTPEGRIVLVIRVFENPVVKSIIFKGNTVIPGGKLKAIMRTKEGQLLNFFSLRRDLQRIQDFYWDNGYIAQVEAPDIRPDGTLLIPIRELKVLRVKVEFLNKKPKTKRKVVWREIQVRPGQPFSRQAIDEDRRRLFLLDIFEEVRVEPKEATDPETGELGVELIYRLKEKKTGFANVGLGYSSRNEIVGFIALQDTNFRGTGQHIRFMAEFFDRKGFDFYYYRPWIDEKRTGFAINLFDRSFFRTPSTALILGGQAVTEDLLFSEDRQGIRVSLRRPEGHYLWHEWKFRTERVKFIQQRLVGGQIVAGAQQDQGRVTGIAYARRWDSRDFPFDPSRGSYLEAELEIAPRFLGSSHNFLRFLMDWRRYIPRGERTVLAYRLLLGSSFGATPIFENFFVGGAETLRGYSIDRFVGRNMIVFNTELRYRFRKELQGVLFVDIGDAFGGPHSLDLKAIGSGQPARRSRLRFKVGYGVGIRILTPFGPLRFDLGFGEEGRQVHFSVGSAF